MGQTPNDTDRTPELPEDDIMSPEDEIAPPEDGPVLEETGSIPAEDETPETAPSAGPEDEAPEAASSAEEDDFIFDIFNEPEDDGEPEPEEEDEDAEFDEDAEYEEDAETEEDASELAEEDDLWSEEDESESMEQSRSRTPRVLLGVMILLVIIALAVLVWVIFARSSISAVPEDTSPTPVMAPVSSPVPTAEPTPAPTAEPTPEPTAEPTPEPTPVSVELQPTEDAGQEYIDKIVFLGDSTTFGLGAYGILPFTQIWTDAIGTLALFNQAIDPIAYYDPADPYNAESLSIAECAARRQPEYLVITLGINGIALLDEAEFKQHYTTLIQSVLSVSPDTKIICQSIYPVIDALTPGGIDNAGVNAANGWIYQVAEETGTRYLNSHDILLDGSGGLDPSYNNGDGMGIHLNEAGFDLVLQNIRTHAYQ